MAAHDYRAPHVHNLLWSVIPVSLGHVQARPSSACSHLLVVCPGEFCAIEYMVGWGWYIGCSRMRVYRMKLPDGDRMKLK